MDILDSTSFNNGTISPGIDTGPPGDTASSAAVDAFKAALAGTGLGQSGGDDWNNGWGGPGRDSLGWSGADASNFIDTAADGLGTAAPATAPAEGQQPIAQQPAASTAAPAAAATAGPGQPADDKGKRDASPPLSDTPTPPGPGTPPPSASAPATAAPDCRLFQGAGQVGGALLGGTAEGLRQAAPGALAGSLAGAGAGAWRGALAGAAAGLPEGGVGAGIGGAGGALRGSVAGAVAGGTPGFVKGFGEGAGPGAAAGAGVGSWLDNTTFGRWVQGCPAPDTNKPADGLQGPQVVTMAQNTSRPYPASQDAQDRARSQQLGYTEPEYDALAEDPDHAGQVDDNSQWERSSLLDAEERGLVPGKQERGPKGTESLDGTGQAWDVKSFDSSFPPRQGGFTPARAIANVEKKLGQGTNVLVDTRWMKPADVQALKQAAVARNWGDRVRILER